MPRFKTGDHLWGVAQGAADIKLSNYATALIDDDAFHDMVHRTSQLAEIPEEEVIKIAASISACHEAIVGS